MSKLKCPFCDGEMIGSGICHYNPDCPIYDNPVPIEVLDLLDCTYKALDLAFEMLKDIKNDPDTNDELTQEIADRLDEITALEQKESASVHNKIEFPEYNDNLLEEFDKQFFENGQDDDLIETALEQKDVK